MRSILSLCALSVGFASTLGSAPASAAAKTYHMAAECQSIGVNNSVTRSGGILFNYGHADADVCPLLAELNSSQMTVIVGYSSSVNIPANVSERPITLECVVIMRDPSNFNDVAVYSKSVVLNAANHPSRFDSLTIQAPFKPPYIATALGCQIPAITVYTNYFLISYEVDQS
jgi:hypothetical protein